MPKLSPDIITAAGLDAGNRSMRQAGRVSWNEDDYEAACREHRRLDLAQPGERIVYVDAAGRQCDGIVTDVNIGRLTGKTLLRVVGLDHDEDSSRWIDCQDVLGVVLDCTPG